MNKWIHVQFKLGLIYLNEKWLLRQKSKKNFDGIHFVLFHGRYDIRKLAVEYLGLIKDKRSLPYLLKAIDDEVQIVSESAMNAIELIGGSQEALKKIEAKRSYWKEQEARAKLKQPRHIPYAPPRKERPSKKSFENLKKMLMKPMNSGKWF